MPTLSWKMIHSKNELWKRRNHLYHAFLFGISPQVTLLSWQLLEKQNLLPERELLTHFPWTLMYCNTYSKWKTMRKLTSDDPKTLWKRQNVSWKHWIAVATHWKLLMHGCLYTISPSSHLQTAADPLETPEKRRYLEWLLGVSQLCWFSHSHHHAGWEFFTPTWKFH